MRSSQEEEKLTVNKASFKVDTKLKKTISMSLDRQMTDTLDSIEAENEFEKSAKKNVQAMFRVALMDKMKRSLKTHQFNMTKDVTRQELNFNVKKDNLINCGTAEIIDEYAHASKKDHEYTFYSLKERVGRIN